MSRLNLPPRTTLHPQRRALLLLQPQAQLMKPATWTDWLTPSWRTERQIILMEVPPFEGDILLLPPPDPPVSYTVTSEASSNLLYGGLPLSQLRRDEYSEVTSQTNDVVFLLIAREALCVGGPDHRRRAFFISMESLFFFFFFFYWWFYIWSNLCLLLENWWKSQDNLSKFLRCSFSICSNVEGEKKDFLVGEMFCFCFFFMCETKWKDYFCWWYTIFHRGHWWQLQPINRQK